RAWATGDGPIPSEPRPPALDTAAASAGVETPAMGAWISGRRIPRRARRSTGRGMISPWAEMDHPEPSLYPQPGTGPSQAGPWPLPFPRTGLHLPDHWPD